MLWHAGRKELAAGWSVILLIAGPLLMSIVSMFSRPLQSWPVKVPTKEDRGRFGMMVWHVLQKAITSCALNSQGWSAESCMASP